LTIAIWILSVGLALFLGAAGFMKSFRPLAEIRKMPWTAKFKDSSIRAIGVAELLGAIGLIAPLASGILPWLSIVAAVCLAVLMFGAARTHVQINDPRSAMVTCVVLGFWALAIAALHLIAPLFL
jgi:uncharacterized membrane protein